MPKGRIDFYDASRGFGFITPHEYGKDVYFHVKELRASGLDSIEKDQLVSYETTEDMGRISAANIRILTP
jgi:CspA family cold shock protein